MRKLLIFCAACLIGISAMAQEIDAVKFVQNGTTDWYMLSAKPKVTFDANFNPVIAGKTYDIAQGTVETFFGKAPATFALSDKTAGQYATICLPKPIANVTNGVLYKISYGNIYEVHFVEETNFTADPAGTPYLVQAEADGDIVFTMADAEPVTAPVGVETANGFVASLQDEMQAVPEGYNYLLVSGGALHSAGPNCQLSKNHAYIDVNYVPATAPEPQGAPRRVVLYNAEAQSPTGLETMHGLQCTMHDGKFLHNGQLLIIRENNVYNAQGQIVK